MTLFTRLSDYLPKEEEEDVINKTQEKVFNKLSDYLPSEEAEVSTPVEPVQTQERNMSQDTISAPEVNTVRVNGMDIPVVTNIAFKPTSVLGRMQSAIQEKFVKPIKEGLFGDDEERKQPDTFLGDFGKEMQTEGMAGALFPTYFDTDNDRFSEAYDRFVKTSGETRANELMEKSRIRGLTGLDDVLVIDADLTESEKKALNDIRINRKVGFIVDAYDLLTLGTGAVFKNMVTDKKFFEGLLGRASEETTTGGIRRVLEEGVPDLKGTKEMDDLVDSVSFAKSNDAEKIVKEAQETFSKTSAGKSDRVVYEDGVPIIKRAEDTAEAIAERDEVRKILKGDGEETRLFSSNNIRDEIKSGLLPVKTTADDTITVYRLENTKGSRPVLGERVVTSNKLVEGAKALEVKVSDLVKTSKGDYAYAPREIVTSKPVFTPVFKQASLAGKNAKDVIKTEKKRDTAKIAAKAKAERVERIAKKQEIDDIAKAKAEPARLKAESDKALKVELDRTARELKVAKAKKASDIKKIDAKRDADILQSTKDSIDTIARIGKRKKTPARDKAIANKRAEKKAKDKRIREQATKDKAKVRKGLEKKESEIEKDLSAKTETILSESKLKKDAADSKVREIEAKEKPPTEKKTKDSKKETEAKKKTDKNVVTNEDGSFKELTPVGKGEIRKSSLYERVMTKSDDVVDSNVLEEAGMEEYRVAHQEDSLVDAIGYIEHVGTDKAMSELTRALRTGSQVTPGVLNNAILVALEGRLLEKGALKDLDQIMRLASQMATHAGQEVNILKMLSPDNPLRVLAETEAKMRKASKSKGNTSQIVKQLQKKIEKGADAKTVAKDAVNKLKC